MNGAASIDLVPFILKKGVLKKESLAFWKKGCWHFFSLFPKNDTKDEEFLPPLPPLASSSIPVLPANAKNRGEWMGRHLPRHNYKLCTHTGRVKSWGKSQRGQKISQNREKGRGREFVDPLQLDPGFSTMRRFPLAPLNLGQCTRNPSPLSPLAKTPMSGFRDFRAHSLTMPEWAHSRPQPLP